MGDAVGADDGQSARLATQSAEHGAHRLDDQVLLVEADLVRALPRDLDSEARLIGDLSDDRSS